MQLSNGVKITKAKAASTSGTASITSDVIDMAGYEGVLFFTAIATTASGNNIKIQQGAESDMSDAADLEGSEVEPTTNANVVWVDVYRPQERYVQAVVSRATASVVGEIYALRYESRIQPQDNDATATIEGVLLISPDEGTA